jgi:transcriptional regulator with XRE-family HTH domain
MSFAGNNSGRGPEWCARGVRVPVNGNETRDGGGVGVPVNPGTDRPSHGGWVSRSVEVVDNRNEVREFLTSRRARIVPEQAGLPAFGRNRRVAGLRREEVALLAGVSVDYYTRLERGNLHGVSEGVLEALAGALQLDEAERAHLCDLARAVSTTAGPSPPGATAGPARCAANPRRDDRCAGVPAEWASRHPRC